MRLSPFRTFCRVEADTEADASGKMLIYLLENGMIKSVTV